jgi:hypothetical protein
MREEGPAALYKGFAPKVLRLAPGGGVLLLVVEFTLNMFRQGKPFCEHIRDSDPKLILPYACSSWAAVYLIAFIASFIASVNHISASMFSLHRCLFGLLTFAVGSRSERQICLTIQDPEYTAHLLIVVRIRAPSGTTVYAQCDSDQS